MEFSIATHYWLIQTSAEKLHVRAGCQSSVSCWLSSDSPVMSSHSSLSLRLSCSQECFNYGAYPGLFFFFLSPRQPLGSQTTSNFWVLYMTYRSWNFIFLSVIFFSHLWHHIVKNIGWAVSSNNKDWFPAHGSQSLISGELSPFLDCTGIRYTLVSQAKWRQNNQKDELRNQNEKK